MVEIAKCSGGNILAWSLLAKPVQSPRVILIEKGRGKVWGVGGLVVLAVAKREG